MFVTLQQLVQLFPQTKSSQLSTYVDPLNRTFDRFTIDQRFRIRAFLAQVGYECVGFTVFEENLNYSADALVKLFPSHFTPTQAKQYARKPQAIANRLYANRMGNGDENSGDGWRFRGRGGIQITGSDNYHAFANYMEMSVEDVISYMNTPEAQMYVSGWFWQTNNLNRWADGQDMLTLTRKINGGTNGLQGRMDIWNRSKTIIT